jgi:3-oxoacyl-[acyl-carrier protein] reductase
MFPGLDGKTALVTGASRGIGKAIAISLARNGCNVIINYVRDEKRAKEVAHTIKDMGYETLVTQADVSKIEDVERLYKKTAKIFEGVDILINNAGVHQHVKCWEMSLKDWKRIIDINLTGAYLCCCTFIPGFIKKRMGRIINISSVVAHSGTDHECHYASSKAGLLGLTKSLALELAPYNVTVNAIAPGYIKTDMTQVSSKKEREDIQQLIPLGRMGEPEEIAHAVCFLVSDLAGYITGETLNINGGLYFY